MTSHSSPTHSTFTRREFLAVCAASGVAYYGSGSKAYLRRATAELRIAVVTSGEAVSAASMLRGIELGLDEGARTAALFGLSVHGEPVADSSITVSGFSALVGGTSEAECRRLDEIASANRILFLNAGCALDALRSSPASNTFHVAPSDAMLEDALGRASGSNVATRKLSPVAWHSSLTRFGAEQLNARFRSRFAEEMDGAAWSGWVAVKILVESALRCKSTDPATLRTFLEAESSRFDGHKGASLSFRREDHQLRQPVYVLESDGGAAPRVVAESS